VNSESVVELPVHLPLVLERYAFWTGLIFGVCTGNPRIFTHVLREEIDVLILLSLRRQTGRPHHKYFIGLTDTFVFLLVRFRIKLGLREDVMVSIIKLTRHYFLIYNNYN
jgi:hypothetical protein